MHSLTTIATLKSACRRDHSNSDRDFLAERTLGGDIPVRFDGRNMAHAKTMYIQSVMFAGQLAICGIAYSIRAHLTELCFQLKQDSRTSPAVDSRRL